MCNSGWGSSRGRIAPFLFVLKGRPLQIVFKLELPLKEGVSKLQKRAPGCNLFVNNYLANPILILLRLLLRQNIGK